jgi:hypothetical protein
LFDNIIENIGTQPSTISCKEFTIYHHFVNSLGCFQWFFSQFPDGAKVASMPRRKLASIPRQIHTDFARLATLFSGNLKTAASKDKCDYTKKKKNKLLSFLGELK